MAHRQKYLAGKNPALTLEEAYWRVISTITEVNDLTYICTKAGFTTSNQQLEADNLHCILVDQNIYLNVVWQNEANIEKLYNTRELIQIIDEEVLAKLAAMKDAIVSLPGSALRPWSLGYSVVKFVKGSPKSNRKLKLYFSTPLKLNSQITNKQSRQDVP